MRILSAFVVLMTAGVGLAEPPFRLPALPTPAPIPTPMPSPDQKTVLVRGQYFVISSTVPLLVDASCGSGSATVSSRKGPFTLPSELAVGYKPDADDPDFVTFTEPYIYAVKAGDKSGAVVVEIIPAINQLDKDGKPIPLTKKDITRRSLDIQGLIPVPVPPTPVDPVVPPTPTPAKSLRVILIYESGDSLTTTQRGVLYGKAIEDWLNANCTGGAAGWRRRDKDSPGDSDSTMASLWTAVQPKVTNTPCIAVERDGKVELINVESSTAKMIEVLNTYKGVK